MINCRYTHALDLVVALVARRRNEFFETVFAIELSFFLNKADILERTTTLGIHADEMIRAPDLAQSSDERSSIIVINLVIIVRYVYFSKHTGINEHLFANIYLEFYTNLMHSLPSLQHTGFRMKPFDL